MQSLLRKIGTTSDEKKTRIYCSTFKKIILTRIFFKFSDTRGPWPLRHIFNKVNGNIIQNPDKVET